MSISKEEIEKRIAKSREKFQRERLKKQTSLESIKKGRAFFHANRDKITSYAVHLKNGYSLAFAALPTRIKDSKYFEVRVCYTIKNPKDTFSHKIAKAYLGRRFEIYTDGIYLTTHQDIVNNPKAFMTLISNLVLGKLYARGLGVSKKLWEAIGSTIKEKPQLIKLS
jgi:hypothetical protein